MFSLLIIETEASVSDDPVSRGELLYQNACTSCHNSDPRVEGPLGPAIAGSSFELLEARVVRGEYPEGYQPKRLSSQMLKMPHFKSEIPALEAYLSSFEE